MPETKSARGKVKGNARSSSVTLAQFAAECAVECSMTLAQVREHSPAQLKLLRNAARRIKADAGLMAMNASYAAFAAVMAKNGKTVFDKLAESLKKAAENE